MASDTPITMWVHHSYEDYAASRCLLIHGLFAGFVLAEQAVEKMLKAYLFSVYPEGTKFVGPKALIQSVLNVTPGHDLVALATIVEQNFSELNLSLTTTHRELLEELSYHFHQKYPDNETPLKSSTTETLNRIDALMVLLSLKIPVEVKTRWRVGIFSSAWPNVLTNQPNPPSSAWALERNQAYLAAFEEIRAEVVNGHTLCYPGQSL